MKKTLINISLGLFLAFSGAVATKIVTKVTPQKTVACVQDKFVRDVGQVDIFKGQGYSKEQMLQMVENFKADEDRKELARQSVEFVFKQDYKQGAYIQAFTDCLNKLG